MSNRELTEELHKPISNKIEIRKVHSSVIDKTWGADLADMQLLSKSKKGFWFLIMCY